MSRVRSESDGVAAVAGAGFAAGRPVRRVEDPDLLRGRGTYVGNLRVPGLLHMAFVRSPLPHAVIGDIDVSGALEMPGVVAAYTAADLGIARFHGFITLNETCARPPLAEDKVRFVGEPVVAVVAETQVAAADALEFVDVDYEPLPAVIDPEEALAEGAPLQFEEVGTNVAAGVREPDGTDPLAGAEVVVRGRFVNQRVAVVPMEGNAITVVPGGDDAAYDVTVHVSTQMPHGFRRIAAKLFGLEPERMRVIAPHVGGAFGGKAGVTAEHAVAIAAARALGRPVSWVETRSENMVAMPHGRGQVQYVELGLSRDGTIMGLRCRMVGDAGAYAGFGGAMVLGPTYTMAQGVYRIPAIGYDAVAALTNTTPMGAFRGAGRPEAAAYLERIMDMAAAELKMDPVQIRRRNLLPPDAFPYTTKVGTTYDSGDYATPLDEALRVVGYREVRAEQEARRRRRDTRLLGIGVSTYVEITASGGQQEYGAIEVHRDGTATVAVGTSAHGQGHATSFSMIVADRLGIPIESVRFVQSDTAVVPRGGGTGGSRSLQLGGNAVNKAAIEVVDRGRRLAASLLEADVGDIVVTPDGRVGVRGVPSAELSWSELAAAASEEGEPLAVAVDFAQEGATFPFGAHVAVVEVDAETGLVEPVRHVAVDDCGRVLNPLIAAGQQHGGVVQGMAQALWEEYVYDADGNPLTSTLADYSMPSAADVPGLEVSNTQTPTPLNPLGAKGIGESATIGSTPAVQNAVIDALSHLGVRHIDMPCTPERVWRAIQDAENGTLPALWREPPAVFATLPVRAVADRPEAADVDI
ncbi:MAG TPA: xanthine dehydrogenase family protein molybdopterin-binding subunit [Streptosporangiaceae bacterium]|jgi:carbon-monoxide dehydrogenase large subunit